MKDKEISRTIKLPQKYIDTIKKSATKNNRSFLGEVRQIIKEWIEHNGK